MEQLLAKLRELWEMHRKEVIIGIISIIFGGYYWYQHQGMNANLATNNAVNQTSQVKSIASSATPTGKVTVDIKGAVNKPGVYTLPKTSRVQEAVTAAGGQTSQADMHQVNLAKELMDQQVVYIPVQGEQLSGVTTASATGLDGSTDSSGSQPKINLNQATKDDLLKISGIGDKKADKIIEYRQSHGQFKTIDELKNVDGFGEKTVAKLKEQLAV
ncbi:helix-hairpin-helix domain-containing protein [Lactobacillus alvi]|uniref:Helix-hairpin-helix domain-containing protein n=1 Tax=Limosilactobacillus alvi TaxID=990412 RepID=A0ABS2EN81_9LACO|nr:helix-hairpin-helix domain-containing protein [Limosilactobacillus alvi]MBM6753531.1 helix-hairpin-helix domain-containing protein [Limosilactobacillus alvi]